MLPDPDELAGRVLCQVKDLATTKAKDVIIKNGDEQYSIMEVICCVRRTARTFGRLTGTVRADPVVAKASARFQLRWWALTLLSCLRPRW
jgi:hypothetical protein